MGLTNYPTGDGAPLTATSAFNAILGAKAMAGTLESFFLDNRSVAGPVIYPWSSLGGEVGEPGANTGGGLGIINDSALTAARFDSLTSLAGGIKLHACPSLATITLPVLASVAGRLSLTELDSVTSLSLASLAAITGAVEISGMDNLTTLTLSALASVAGQLNLDHLSALTSIVLPHCPTRGNTRSDTMLPIN